MALAVDSAKPLLNEIVGSLRRLEEILAYVGIFYIGKLTLPTLWQLLKGIKIHVFSKFTSIQLVERYGKWAVVTESTEGIGKAYAFELAKNGMNVVLISRTIKELEKVAMEIKTEFGVETEVVQADFSRGRDAYSIISRSLSQKDIGVLVNNVGETTFQPTLMEDIAEDDLWEMVNVNVGAVPQMTKIILPGMVERKRGVIINIASMSAIIPLPYRQISMATKAFVKSFSRALEYEYRSSGIMVQTLLPGRIHCDKDVKSSQSNFLVPSASTYAYHALSTLGHSYCTTGYWAHGFMAWIFQMIPESSLMWSYALSHKPSNHQQKTKSQ